MAATLLAHTWARGDTVNFHNHTNVRTDGSGQGGVIDSSGAGLIVVCWSSSNARVAPQQNYPGNFIDTYSNEWLAANPNLVQGIHYPVPYSTGGFDECEISIIYAVNPVTGPGHVFTAQTGAGNVWQFTSFEVLVFSGVQFTQVLNTGHGETTSADTVQPGALTAPAGAVLAVCGMATYYSQASDATINQSFVKSDFVQGSAPPQAVGFWSHGGGAAYLIDPGNVSLNPTWTCDANTNGRAAQLVIWTYEAGASLFVHKTVQPSNSGQSFDFTIDGGLSPGSFALGNGDTQAFEGISAGTYDLEEAAVANWSMTSTVSNGSPLNAISVSGGEVVHVDIVNTLNTPPTPQPVIREMRRVRQSPHLWDGKQNYRMFFKKFELLGEMGGPRDDDAEPLKFALEVSKDGGNTWGPRVWQEASFLGQYKFRVIWWMRFQARGCMVRVSDSNAARVIINDLLVEAEQGIN